MAAFVAPGVSHAKPSPGAPLNGTVCKAIGGVWTLDTCTIPEGTSGVVSSSFKIGYGIKLDVKGSLTIHRGVTVANSGILVVENAGGVLPGDYDPWETGILIYGTLDNAGTMTVANAYDVIHARGTEGVTVSFSLDLAAPGSPSPYVIVPGALTNSGAITIQNSGQTRGIKNMGALANSASGTITVANSLTSSVGIYNRREDLPPKFYVDGTLANAGTLTLANSGDATGYGLYNVAVFTNSASGTFAIQPSGVTGDAAGGFYNAGSFTNYGHFVNDRGAIDFTNFALSTWGSFNLAGTMINYGTTTATGTFYNELIMINLGVITSHGVFVDQTAAQTMINYGTFYNYGLIGGGENKGICIDEVETNPEATGC